MGYSVYYNGEIGISPKLNEKHEAPLEEALRKDTLALLGITADDEQSLCYACDWRLCDGCLSIEGESRGNQDAWLRLLIARFFQLNGYTLSGEVSWEGGSFKAKQLGYDWLYGFHLTEAESRKVRIR